MEKILVSACLLGEKTKYDGGDNYLPCLKELRRYFDFVPFCPEVEGGLPIPRLPSEQRKDRVFNQEGKEVTAEFRLGAEKAVRLCRLLGIRIAILKQRSPSCGSKEIYDGSFSGKTKPGQGVTASLLLKENIWIMDETEIPAFLEKKKRREETKNEYRARQRALANGEKAPTPRKNTRLGKGHSAPSDGQRPRKPFKKEKPFEERKNSGSFKKRGPRKGSHR